MAFEKFKSEIRKKSIKEVKNILTELRKELMIINRPIERATVIKEWDSSIHYFRTETKHPHKKIKKQIAICKTIIKERETEAD